MNLNGRGPNAGPLQIRMALFEERTVESTFFEVNLNFLLAQIEIQGYILLPGGVFWFPVEYIYFLSDS